MPSSEGWWRSPLGKSLQANSWCSVIKKKRSFSIQNWNVCGCLTINMLWKFMMLMKLTNPLFWSLNCILLLIAVYFISILDFKTFITFKITVFFYLLLSFYFFYIDVNCFSFCYLMSKLLKYIYLFSFMVARIWSSANFTTF